MENVKRYNKLNEYLKNRFGERTLKICVDGGFTCPNRDGTISTNGCIFCSERGSGDHMCAESSIKSQVEQYFKSYRSERANKFIVYFQNFTNTYDTVENLKRKYDSALIDDRIVGLEIATRPDCINEDVCKLLASYADKYYVCVELGLQTSNEATAKFINRGYENKVFTEAVKLLKSYGIDVVVHIMIGLPGETLHDLDNTIRFVNNHTINGIKIHNVYVVKNTVLADMYYKEQYKPMEFEKYLEYLVYTITHLRPDIIIHRISGDAPKDLLIAPEWNVHKKWVLNGLDKKLKQKNLSQGLHHNSVTSF
ncbi:MAG: TIGR01212 family radical SAM protein [Clostridia bacterium]|nr:TIGR01212 family radical SAM protein [Clostridia bacterium]